MYVNPIALHFVGMGKAQFTVVIEDDPQLQALEAVWLHRSVSHLNTMLKEREAKEQYEQCAVIRDILTLKAWQVLLKK